MVFIIQFLQHNTARLSRRVRRVNRTYSPPSDDRLRNGPFGIAGFGKAAEFRERGLQTDGHTRETGRRLVSPQSETLRKPGSRKRNLGIRGISLSTALRQEPALRAVPSSATPEAEKPLGAGPGQGPHPGSREGMVLTASGNRAAPFAIRDFVPQGHW